VTPCSLVYRYLGLSNKLLCSLVYRYLGLSNKLPCSLVYRYLGLSNKLHGVTSQKTVILAVNSA